MLTRDQVFEQIKGGRETECFDGRDYSRLAQFFPVEDWAVLGREPAKGFDPDVHKVKDWTRANILSQLAEDVSFGFEKALDKRGISAGMMHACVTQWMWILEDPLHAEADNLYTRYGLSFFKAVALKYDLTNEIGDDAGDEHKYSMDG